MERTNSKKPNRLIEESSPYLLQHAYNPVDWFPWGEEALQLARRHDRPILLSVGYSACHWCHVMERESFENEEIARLMNELYVNIKVDREERPDLDAIYMNYVQMTTGSGGWPLTVFLTPDQIPIYGGTYFPPEDRFGRPGFSRVLTSVAEAFRSRSDELAASGPNVVSRLEQAVRIDLPEEDLTPNLLGEAYAGIGRPFDPRYGGFGNAPKFPSSMVLAYLLRHHSRTGSLEALNMVEVSLQEMGRGGIYDQLGGGFHRYSVDERWLVPHFEKMLYDNALLVRLCLETFQVTGKAFYRKIAEESLAWVQREMTLPEGGFCSAQDADSEGEEGKFYVWSLEEVREVLGRNDGDLFADFFDVTAHGNFEGHNILHQRFDLAGFARLRGLSLEDTRSLLDGCRRRLLGAREKRVRPGRDDKALACWNGLMLSAFAAAALVLNRSDLLETAIRNADFLVSQMLNGGRLLRAWKDGSAKLNAYVEDYAAVVEGLLAVFEVSGDPRWLQQARKLADTQIDLFLDGEKGDFFFTSSDHERLLVRPKEHLDNATPSGNSTSCFNLLRLARFLDEERYERIAVRMLRHVAAALPKHPLAFGNWLQALDFHFGPVVEVAILGPGKEREDLLRPLRERFLPNKVVVQSEDGDSALPLLRGRTALDGRATVYVCRNYVCRQPVTRVEDLEKQLDAILEKS